MNKKLLSKQPSIKTYYDGATYIIPFYVNDLCILNRVCQIVTPFHTIMASHRNKTHDDNLNVIIEMIETTSHYDTSLSVADLYNKKKSIAHLENIRNYYFDVFPDLKTSSKKLLSVDTEKLFDDLVDSILVHASIK